MKQILLAITLAIAISVIPITHDKIDGHALGQNTIKYEIGSKNGIFRNHCLGAGCFVFGDSNFTKSIARDNLLLQEQKIRRETIPRGIRSAGVRIQGVQLCRKTWSEEDCQKLDYIITNESGWVVGIENAEGCKGLSQSCPGSKLGKYAGTLEGEVEWTMIEMDRYYRKDKQGNIYIGRNGAYQHKLLKGWW